MTPVIRGALVVPLALLLAGCSEAPTREFRSASAAERSGRTPGRYGEARRVRPDVSVREAEPAPRLFAQPTAPEPRHDVTLDEIRGHVRDHTAVLIDARASRDFERAHVEGAFNVPAGQVAAYMEKIRARVAPNELVIIYCAGPYCDSGDMVYEYLASQGYVNMRVFKPGWEALSKAKDLQSSSGTRRDSSSVVRSGMP